MQKVKRTEVNQNWVLVDSPGFPSSGQQKCCYCDIKLIFSLFVGGSLSNLCIADIYCDLFKPMSVARIFHLEAIYYLNIGMATPAMPVHA